MRSDRDKNIDIGSLIPDVETIIISASVLGVAVYGRYQQVSEPTIWFGLLLIGWALFLIPKIYLLIEKGSKGWGLHCTYTAFIVIYRIGYVLMGLSASGLIISLLT